MSQPSPPSSAPEFPQPQPLGGPPPRPGRPWWVWVLGGCGGCALLGVILAVALGAWGYHALWNEMRSGGSANTGNVLKALGSDVPVFPRSQVSTPATAAMRAVMIAGSPFSRPRVRGVGGFVVVAAPEQVRSYYTEMLPRLGWRPTGSAVSNDSQDQRFFQKGGDGLMVQSATSKSPNGVTVYFLIRGDAGFIMNIQNEMRR